MSKTVVTHKSLINCYTFKGSVASKYAIGYPNIKQKNVTRILTLKVLIQVLTYTLPILRLIDHILF